MNRLPKPSTMSPAEWGVLTYLFQGSLVALIACYGQGSVPKPMRVAAWCGARRDAHRWAVGRGCV